MAAQQALRAEPVGAASLGIHNFYFKTGAPRRPCIVRGEGIFMWDRDGRRYIDVSSGPVVNNLGHGNRRVLAAMQAQAEKIVFVAPSQFDSEPSLRLSELIAELAGPGLERAFFTSGGSEAVESAMKLARQYAVALGEGERWKVIGREPGYHGATLGAIAVGGDVNAEAMFAPLARMMPKVPAPLSYRVPDNHTPESYARACAAALERTIREEGPETVLAFIMEPVGGLATGALVAPDAYYKAVREICTRYGVLLIFDEVMSGAGRTGRFLAAEHWGVRPDLAVLAKGLAAGYTPFGAVLASAELVGTVAEAGGFLNGFTYFANPLSCAVAEAVVRETLERGLFGQAEIMGESLATRLRALAETSAIIGDVRGKGLLLALELVADKASKRMIPIELMAPNRFQELALDHGLAVYCRRTNRGRYGDWMMISPPLIVTEAELDELVGRLGEALAQYERELRAKGVL